MSDLLILFGSRGESIFNAVAIYKKLRSRSPFRAAAREYLYIIQSTNLYGVPIYSKGKLVAEKAGEVYYFLVQWKPDPALNGA